MEFIDRPAFEPNLKRAGAKSPPGQERRSPLLIR
jgi:hypothetical protein